MEFEHDDLLIDQIKVNELLQYRINLNLLSARPKHALTRALAQSGTWETPSRHINELKSLKFLELRDITQLRISDIRDLTSVGESTLVLLIQELQSAISEYTLNSEISVNAIELNSLESLRADITLSKTIQDLTEAMLSYQRTIQNVSEREELIWRSRLPWITDKPRTLDAIGTEVGITRERVRQIQRKSSRYSYEIGKQVFVLAEVQNILLECTNHEEFRDAMLEEELTTEDSITLGRIRHLAVELNQKEVVNDVEKAIYAWARGFSNIGDWSTITGA